MVLTLSRLKMTMLKVDRDPQDVLRSKRSEDWRQKILGECPLITVVPLVNAKGISPTPDE